MIIFATKNGMIHIVNMFYRAGCEIRPVFYIFVVGISISNFFYAMTGPVAKCGRFYYICCAM